jgi:acyl-CoA synthetase (AMP-forming)/AMP-acid ligase II
MGETMKFGFVSMPFAGHLNPMTALAGRLQSRGNEVVFFGVPDAEPFARAARLDFAPFCENEYPAGSIAGKPIQRVEICVVDAEGENASDGQIGKIAVRSPARFAGYWGDPAATQVQSCCE